MTPAPKTTRAQRNLLLRGSILAAMGALGYGCTTTVTVTDGAGGSSSASSTSSSSSSTSSSSSGIPAGVCPGGEAIVESDGTESGYARCPDGTVHRYDATIACSTAIDAPSCAGTETEQSCSSDADCTERPNGKCTSMSYVDFGGDVTACGCVYPCATDADCGAQQACVCDGVLEDDRGWSYCAPASCADGADCESNECGASSYNDGCGYSVGLGCRAPSDACRADSECTEDWQSCALQYGTGPWLCVSQDCAIGRPLLMADGARTAPSAQRSDWTAAVTPDLGLDAATRRALADHWERVAALEHASVASFARFSLQLMALGAPPDLLAEAQAAARDEIDHARLAYALASAYAGRALGPGPLPLEGLTFSGDRRSAMLELVAEACVGETLGVAEARELAAAVADGSLREVYARIADDEQRHAELAWRALAWMLTGADAELAAEVRAAFDAAARAAESARLGDPPVVDIARGLPSGAELMAIRRQALREVVLPCAQALFA